MHCSWRVVRTAALVRDRPAEVLKFDLGSSSCLSQTADSARCAIPSFFNQSVFELPPGYRAGVVPQEGHMEPIH
jgi:hypothetical protein